VVDEGTQQIGFMLQRAGVSAANDGKPLDIGAGEIRQGLSLEVAPEVFDRVEFRCVGREVERQRVQASEKGRDEGPAVRLGAIPDQDHGRGEMAGQLLEEAQDRRRIEGRVDQQVKIQADLLAVGAHTEGGDRRDLLAVAATLPEHRRLPAPAPRASYHGQQE
jgi:hypothetical protein